MLGALSRGKSGASHSLLFLLVLLLLLGGCGCALFLQVHDELVVVLLWIPLEASQDWVVQLVIGLDAELAGCAKKETDLLENEKK